MVLASHQQEDTKIKSQTQELLTNNLKGGKKKKIWPADVGHESEEMSYSELISTVMANNNSKLFIDYP